MTIKVTIENSDLRESAVIEVEVCSRRDKTTGLQEVNPTGDTTLLHGGEKVEKYVHSSQDLHIREVSQ